MQAEQTPIAFSGSIPKNYDAFLGPLFFELYAIDLASRIKKLQPSNILELASGTGRLTKLLPAVASKSASVIASDINPAMVSFGQKEVNAENVKWQVADAISLPFADETFDCVVVQFGVMFYSDRIKAFREAWRVLKPGGVFLFNAWNELKKNPPSFLAQKTLEHFFPVDTPAFFSVPYSYFDETLIRSDLEKAGFKNIETELVKLTGHGRSAADTAKGLLQGTPAFTAIEERDAEKLPLIVAHLETEIANQFGKENLEVPLEAWVATARKG
jgi:ubiquinone/menaquinone biosynthesis C-methylase UbiE